MCIATTGVELTQENRDWFEPLVETLAPAALKFAYMQVRNLELAQDIVQEAFARVWASARTPRPAPEFKRWLYRAITNLAIDHHRRQQRMPALVAPNELRPVQGDEFERWLSNEMIMTALQRLSLRHRQLIYLRYFEGQPMAECARLLGLHPVSVRVMVKRALERLRHELVSLERVPEVAPHAP